MISPVIQQSICRRFLFQNWAKEVNVCDICLASDIVNELLSAGFFIEFCHIIRQVFGIDRMFLGWNAEVKSGAAILDYLFAA